MMLHLDEQNIKAAVYGGTLLGGGGGGMLEDGLAMGSLACKYGYPQLIAIDDLNENDRLITVAMVGAPAAQEQHVKACDHVEAAQLLINQLKHEDITVKGIITNENGGVTTLNGLIQSAVLGIPVVDAPCNGRAHPIGSMGSMGLHNVQKYLSYQAASGGDPARGKRHQILVSGSVSNCSNIVRDLAVKAGGMVAVARNPVTAGYAGQNAAVGAIRQAIELGKNMLAEEIKGPYSMALSACKSLAGRLVLTGYVHQLELNTEGGFDTGRVIVLDEKHNACELTFWNEYMTLEQNGKRLATFPDLIMTISLKTGIPLPSASLKTGDNIAVIITDLKNLKLGRGMYDRKLYKLAEKTVSKEIVSYLERRLFNVQPGN